MLMENSKDDLERHKAVTVSLAPPPPPKQPAIITTVPTSTTNNATTMSSAVTEPHLSSLKRSHTVTSNVMTDIEQTITILLTCTKKFLDALTSWSMNHLNNDQVISIYQHLADQFDRVKESLQAAQITMSDVEHIPEELYESLAATLDNYPSSKTALEQHLPAIRNIILRMLQSLKKKQAQLREMTSSSIPLLSPRRTSAGSNSSTGTMSSSVSSPISSSHRITTAISNSNSNRSSSSSGNNRTGSSDLDMTDVNTQNALAELKQQENLARRSSIRRSIIPASSSTLKTTPSSALQVDTTNNNYNNHDTTTNNNSPITPPRRHPTLIRNSKRESLPQQQRLHEITTAEEKEKEIKKGAFPLFLQVGDQVKKIMWQQHEPVTQAALSMAFLQKFGLKDKNNTTIKIQDPVSGIMYELEDMNDVGPHNLLLLITSPTSSLASSLLSPDNVNMISTKLDLIHQTLQENQKLHQNHYETPVTTARTTTTQLKESTDYNAEMFDYTILKQQQGEIEYLRRDLGVLRQVAKEFQQDTTTLLHELKNTIATTTIITETKNMHSCSPTTIKSKEQQQQQGGDDDAGDNNGNIVNISSQRNYVMETKQRAEHVSTEITRRMQDLQDTIEQLKLDVTQRRCRPSQTQLEHCDKETRSLEREIEQLSKLLKSVKPTWKHTWEIELQTVVKEQQFLKEQENLLLDLHDDHADLLHILKQLQKISEIQQQSHGKTKSKPIPQFRGSTASNNNYTNNETMSISSSGGEEAGDMSNVLKQVSIIEVDHGKRVKALEQAEKMRARELANRIDDFEKELSSFVGSRKLKKTGGADHVDRQRERKDKQILKNLYQSKKEINHNDNNNKNNTKNPSSSS